MKRLGYRQVRRISGRPCYPVVSGGKSVLRLRLGKLLVNLLQVVKGTNMLRYGSIIYSGGALPVAVAVRRRVVDERQDDWDLHLPHVELTYNNSVSAVDPLGWWVRVEVWCSVFCLINGTRLRLFPPSRGAAVAS